MLLTVIGVVGYKLTSPEQREHSLQIAIEYLERFKIAVTEPGPDYHAFFDALRARRLHLVVVPAIALIGAEMFIGMRSGAAATNDQEMLLAWGASIGTLTTNGGWWRLVTSTFVYTSAIHLLLGLAVLIQVGRILERVVGRLTVAAVYLSAGVFTGLVNLSSRPLAVTVGTSGALFGLYGLLIALLIWQIFREWRVARHAAHAHEETTVSAVAADAEPAAVSMLHLLDRPALEPSTPAPSKLHAKAEAGPPPLDPSWGLPPETPEPLPVETWTPTLVNPAVEPSNHAVEESSPAITWRAADTPEPAAPAPTTTVPLVVLKRIGTVAAVFLLYSMFAGFAGGPEFAGLFVGLMYGLVLARRADECEPTRRPIAFAAAAAGVVAIVSAVAMRNIADVKPEIAAVLALEERTAAAYRTGFDSYKKGRMTGDALAQLAEQTIVPELQSADARLAGLTNVPLEHQGVVAEAREYLRLRCASWRAHATALRKVRVNPDRAAGEPALASWRLQAERQFRTNLAVMGAVESADRESRDAFERLKLATPR